MSLAAKQSISQVQPIKEEDSLLTGDLSPVKNSEQVDFDTLLESDVWKSNNLSKK